MYKVIAKANLYISGRAAMEARRLSKCEYGTERQQNLLKMPLALCGTGHRKRERERGAGGCLAVDWTAGADLSTGFWGSGPAPAPACAFAFAFFMATITFHRFTFGRFGRVCCMLLVCVLYLAYGAYITAESRELCPRPLAVLLFGVCGNWRLADCR